MRGRAGERRPESRRKPIHSTVTTYADTVVTPHRSPARADVGLVRREQVDYTLQRNAVLREFRRGRVGGSDACDADPYLLRAARWHGERADRPCPVCTGDELRELSFVYGPELGPFSGRIKHSSQLCELAEEVGDVQVHVAEVCLGCGWNHLARSFRIGDGRPRRPLRKPADWLD